MRLISTLAAKEAAQKKVMASIEQTLTTLETTPIIRQAATLRSLKKQIDQLKKLLPGYRLEYDTDARTEFLAQLKAEYLELGTGPAFAQAVSIYGEDYFSSNSDTPRFDRELKEMLHSVFQESSLPAWKPI